MIHLVEQNCDMSIRQVICADIPHYDIIEWLKTRYGIVVTPSSNNLLYHPHRKDLNFAIKYDLSVCYGSFGKFKGIPRALYWNSYKELIARGLVNILSRVESFETYVLYAAIEMLNEEAFKIIIEKIPKIEPIIPTKTSLLKAAIEAGNITFVRMVSEKLKEQLKDRFKYELIRIGAKGDTLLHTASKQSSKEVFNYVCEMISREWSERMLLMLFNTKNSLKKTPTDYLEALHDKPYENIPTEVSMIRKGHYGKLNIEKVI